jgi:hypothetical protein
VTGMSRDVADDKAEGARPFWTHISVCNLIDVRTQFIKGCEIVTHARWWEYPSVADGFAESCIPQVRVVEIKDGGRVYWAIWQKQSNGNFAQTDSGELSAMTVVPLVRVFTGRKICHVALEYYRSLARQTEIENFSGWPMLAGQGIAKGTEEIELGPNTVLFAPPSDGNGGSKWEILGPDAALVEQIGKSPERVLDVFSKLAMEPTFQRPALLQRRPGSTTPVHTLRSKHGPAISKMDLTKV